ncbi:hypothetical protein Ancab_007536 [Ancistrocladus abbreviatus]
MAWAPKYGLKGMIDASVRVRIQSDGEQANEKGTLVRRSDVIGLFTHRNELARDIMRASMVQQLPPKLRSPNMCKSCRHLNVCTIYHKAHGGNADSSGLGDIFDSLTSHLTNSHIMFLKQWDRLIDLEAKKVQVRMFYQLSCLLLKI